MIERARISARLATGALLLFIALSLLRANWATGRDGFTIDEPWHIVAGAFHARLGDYRLNPEQGPLVKLWVGALLDADTLRLPHLRRISDKYGERRFTEEALYLLNDPNRIQKRVRAAMSAFSALLLGAFSWVVWRTVSAGTAVGTILLLGIDPTVAAHLPTVMVDLAVAVFSVSAVMLAAHAFRTWSRIDLLLAGLFLGLAIGTKHSGLTTVIFAALIGLGATLLSRKWNGLVWTAGMLAVALLVLWGLFRFQYAESAVSGDVFNRPLHDKIEDLHSPATRQLLKLIEVSRIVPRAYLWGLADTIHEGIEGRSIIVHAFGRTYDTPPWYLFPGFLLVKLPLGLIALSLGGMFLMAKGRIPWEGRVPLNAVGMYGLVFLLLLMPSAAYYAGVRHAFRGLIVMALLGGMAIEFAFRKQGMVRLLCVVALAAACASALPAIRPWEYHNELAGSTVGAFRYFSNEGVDLGQRTGELAAYYNEFLKPKGEIPYLLYDMCPAEIQHRGIQAHYYGSPQGAGDESSNLTGTFLVSTLEIALTRRQDYLALLQSQPVARFGNLLIFRGTYHLPEWRAWSLYVQALDALYSENPDPAKAEPLLEQVIALRPMMVGAAVELGNLAAKRGDRETALRAYRTARQYTAPGDPAGPSLNGQIARLGGGEDTRSIQPLRNPWME